MPNTVLGKVSLTPRGVYRSGIRYTALDLVGHEGGGYIALREVQDIAPSDDGVNWMLLAARGGEGIQGEQGIQGYVFTPSVSAEGVVSWTNNGDLPNPDPVDIMGPEGPRGPQGDSVVSIEHTGGTGAPGTTDTYTVKLSNGSIAGTFQVYNGADGNGAGDFKADGSIPMTGNLQMGGNRVVGVGSAQESTDAVNKSDLDKAIQSVTITTDAEPVEGSLNPVQSGGVFSALSNKANKYTSGVEFPPQTVHEILDMEPGVYSWIQESPLGWEPKDTPSGLLRVEFSKQHGEGTALTYNLAYTDGATNLRRYFGESGPDATIRWGRIPVATPPQRYVLQLADGWVRVNAAEYWRTQEGLVIVTFRIARSGGAEISAAPHPIATLPEGYRPVGYAAHVAASTMTAVPAVVWVGDDGVIYASAAQDIPGSSDPAPGNWPGFVATMVFCAN